jgi:integrase
MAKEQKTWSFKAGDRPFTVTVYERERGGIICARVWDGSARNGTGNFLRVSLGHRDKARAKRYAIEEAAKLQTGNSDIERGKVTLAQVFAAYLKFRTPRKAKSEQQADERRAELWARVLGNTCPHNVSMAQWQSFIGARMCGAIDARGNAVPEEKRTPVRARSAEADCTWLWLVFNWAVKWRTDGGRYLMRENPVRGYEMPREQNPLQPVASQDRFEAVRAISDGVLMEVRPKGKRILQRSYLSELLDLADTTGRRLSAICGLRFEDLQLEKTATAPHGAILWPARTDKKRKARTAPLAPRARAAIDRIVRERPGIGTAPLFPSPTNQSEPISRHLADAWLRKAEKNAKLSKQKGGVWHPYRRKWATERKHLPDVDVAQAGGWESLDALKRSYQHADPTTMLSVVLGGAELREVKQG